MWDARLGPGERSVLEKSVDQRERSQELGTLGCEPRGSERSSFWDARREAAMLTKEVVLGLLFQDAGTNIQEAIYSIYIYIYLPFDA